MKKIFAISVLSIMTVLSSNAWASDTSVKEAYGLGSAADYNIATVKFVGETAVPQWAGWHNENKVLRTDGNSNVIFSDTIDQDQVSGLTDALAGKVDDTQIADADAPVTAAKMDTMVPTVQRMANAIADAVSTGVGAVDLSSRVAVDQGTEKANQVLVTGDDGKVTTATTITQAQVENLSTDLAAKFDAANVIDASEFDNVKPEDLTGKVYGADVVYLKDVLLAGAISGEESIPYDIMHEDGSIVTSLQTPDKHSLIDGINSVYDVVKTNKTDIGNKVDKAEVIKADGTTTLAGTTVDAASLNKDTVAPTIANVEENFAPRVAEVAYNNGENTYIEKPSDLPYGSYALVVDVYEDTTTYRWVAMSTGSSGQIGCVTTAGNRCPK